MSTEETSATTMPALASQEHDTPDMAGGDEEPLPAPDTMDIEQPRETQPGSPTDSHAQSHSNGRAGYREKQVKANKVYIGGLPETTRQEDLQACFGKIGRIVNIELKLGYGFVEFDSRAAAEESVAEYHEGYFMGNKIRVELSHGGGRTAKYAGEPGACFKCGQHGHWARECPNNSSTGGAGGGRSDSLPAERRSDAGARPSAPPISGMKDEYRDGPTYRADPPPLPPTRGGPPSDRRYYDYPAAPAPRDLPPRADYRYPPARPGSPPRDVRDLPPVRSSRDYYDDRRDYRGPPPQAPPPPRYDSGGRPFYPEYDPRGPYGAPPVPVPRDAYDRPPYDRRGPPAPPLPASGPYVPGSRPRSPPRGRDDYDRPRDYIPPPTRSDYRGRSPSYSGGPPRPGDYPPPGYRRRSMSPPSRGGPPPNGQYRPPYAPPGIGMGPDGPYPPGPPGGAGGYDYPRGYHSGPPTGPPGLGGLGPRGGPPTSINGGGPGRDRGRDDRRSSLAGGRA